MTDSVKKLVKDVRDGADPREAFRDLVTDAYYETMSESEAWVEALANLLGLEEGWADNVKGKWDPPEGIDSGSASDIAATVAKGAKNLKQASDRLNFFINRWGSKAPSKVYQKLNKALDMLPKQFGKK